MQKRCLYSFFLVLSLLAGAQNEATKWYFGNQAGLDFMTSPPTILTNGVLSTSEGCSSISNSAGQLLFYTDGITIWNANHVSMANGTGLLGNGSSTQSGVIVKQPGSSTIYYVFTQDDVGGVDGLRYSVVDMSLSTGQGSVTAKNILLHQPSCEKVTSVRHCNGTDIWLITHDVGSNVFRNFLITSSGISTTAVTSSVGVVNSTFGGTLGQVKASPNGKKLGVALFGDDAFEVFDFDPATGIVSNAITLLSGSAANDAYGCEFSPDGTKFYGSRWGTSNQIFQWDLCAGSNSAIIASTYTYTGTLGPLGSMQLAVDGKIYVAKGGQSHLGVINSPNSLGAAANYSSTGQSISPKICYLGLPNFITSWFKPPPDPFTYTLTCQTASFTAPVAQNNMTLTSCAALGYSLNSMQWNFGDPLSGSSNTSTAQNPTHSYAALGTYTVSLIMYYTCGGGTDTIKQVINVNQPCITVNSSSITCASLGSATVQATGGIGPFSYTWMPGNQTSSVATGLSPGIYTIAVHDQAVNFSYTATTIFTSLIPLTGNISHSSSLTCHGAATGTGAVQNISGGSGSQFYAWHNGAVTYTNANPQNLSAGIWSITVTDSLTGCTIKQSFFISQPSPATINITASSPSACVNSTIGLNATSQGGSAPYSYTWTNGPSSATTSVTSPTGGTFVYTVSSTDLNGCATSNTIATDFIDPPVLSVGNVSVCPFNTGTLIANGASTYTWNNNSPGAVFTDAPSSTTVYTVSGSALGCSSTTMAYIYVFIPPVPLIASNSPLCEGKDLQLSASGGNSYMWQGPNSFVSGLSSPAVAGVTPGNSGVYNVTVTSAQGCTASTGGSVVVYPSPTLSAIGSTVCSTQTISLYGSSAPGNSYYWTGPQAFQSNLQNPLITSPIISKAGNYTLTVTSAETCTNSAVAHVSVAIDPVVQITSDDPKCAGANIQLSANGGGSYNWAGPGGFSSVLSNPVITNAQPTSGGVYSLTVTYGPCISSAQKTITVYALPTVTATSNSPVCETGDLELNGLSGTGVTTYSWTGPSYSSQGPSQIRSNSHSGFSGVYTLSVTDGNNCSAYDQTTVDIAPNPTLSVTGATVCLMTPAVLSASGADSYSWSGPQFFQSVLPDATVPAATPLSQGVYTVVGKAVNNCSAVATVTLDYLDLPSPHLEISDPEVCLNDEVLFKGSGAELCEWFTPDGAYHKGSTLLLKAGRLSMAGTYTLKVTDGSGCSASVTQSLKVNGLPDGTLAGTEPDCIPFCRDLRFIPAGNQPEKIRASWQAGGAYFAGRSFRACFVEEGQQIIQATLFDSITGCSNMVTFEINALPIPQAAFSYEPREPVEYGDPVRFTDQSAGEMLTTWNWFIGDKWNAELEGTSPSHYFDESGSYAVALVVSNSYGCTDTVIKEVRVLEDVALYVPDIFTPNGDDHNEKFNAKGTGIRRFHLRIFDRWGELVFETTDMNEGWDGRFRNNECKSDVYNWRINYSSTSGEARILTGHVMLCR